VRVEVKVDDIQVQTQSNKVFLLENIKIDGKVRRIMNSVCVLTIASFVGGAESSLWTHFRLVFDFFFDCSFHLFKSVKSSSFHRVRIQLFTLYITHNKRKYEKKIIAKTCSPLAAVKKQRVNVYCCSLFVCLLLLHHFNRSHEHRRRWRPATTTTTTILFEV
jgi:hypothetical protein